MLDHVAPPTQPFASRAGECRCGAPLDHQERRPLGRLGCTCVSVPLGNDALLRVVWNDLPLLDRRVIRARSAALFAFAGDVQTEREALAAAYEGFPADVVLAHRQQDFHRQRAEIDLMPEGANRRWHEGRLVALYCDIIEGVRHE